MEKDSEAPVGLLGRRRELAALDDVITGARRGRSASLVLHSAAGIGKTALLHYARASATGCRVARATGSEAEVELACAGLHQLCAPFLDQLDQLLDPGSLTGAAQPSLVTGSESGP